MKCFLQETKQAVSCTNNNFISRGRHGKVYRFFKSSLTQDVKILFEPNQHKLEELKKLSGNANIATPKELMLHKNEVVGYSMPHYSNHINVGDSFSNEWRRKHPNFTSDVFVKLLKQFVADMDYIHKRNCLVVDFNQRQFLLDDKFSSIKFIGVDSYQTRTYKAEKPTKYYANIENEDNYTYLTDWYSWGILVFQWITGIHPFQGWYEDTSLAERMKKNISILNDTNYCKELARPITCISPSLLDWFQNIFAGNLSKPPIEIGPVQTIESKDEVVVGEYVNLSLAEEDLPVSCFNYDAGNIQATVGLKNGVIHIDDEPTKITASQMCCCNGRVILCNDFGNTVYELIISKYNKTELRNILEVPCSCVKLYDGIVVVKNDDYTECFILDDYRKHRSFRISELNKYTNIVNAKYQNNFAMFVCLNNSGTYTRLAFHFRKRLYNLKYIKGGCDSSDISMAVNAGNTMWIVSDNGHIIRCKPTYKYNFRDLEIKANWSLTSHGYKFFVTTDGKKYYRLRRLW